MNSSTLRNFLLKYNLTEPYYKLNKWFSSVQWPRLQAMLNNGIYYRLEEKDHDILRRMLKEDYFFILTRRRAHLTTYLIALVSWFSTKKKAHYTHALMNTEGDIANNIDFKLVEATNPGTHYSTFMQVFDCDSVVLLKPKGVTIDQWTNVLEKAKTSIGAKYDDLFDLTESEKMSCVELCYVALQQFKNYRELFPNLVKLLEENTDLTPQLLYDCGDLDVVYEARR